MSDLTIGGETFRVEVAGDPTRPAVMLAHPLGADLVVWDGQLAALTKHFRVIRYDARGHGGSVVSAAPGSIAQLGGDALAILDALEIDKVHWLGLSMGGAVGLWLLANAPGRIDRAVLANTAPLIGAPDVWNARIVGVLADGMDENAAATIERWFSPEFAAASPDRVGAVHAVLRNVSSRGYAAACTALRDMDLREASRGIGHDVLIITGTHDPVVPPDDAAAFVAAVPGARHVALAARHLSNIEAEAAFNAAVVAFLTAKATPRKVGLRKAAPAKAAPAKRGGAGRRSNAARSPLKKAPAKKTAAKKASPKKAVSKNAPAATSRRVKATTRSTRRGAAPKAAQKTAPRKAKPAAKTTVKTAPARRPTSTVAARGPVKKALPKKPAKKAATKTPAKKATPKVAAKKLPGARRRTTKKSGRPTGRRKT